ncbi:hypothetical protein GCM10023330_15780 [Litoribaculum gwangyangense]|uniref:GH16 domain-containing protein n=2 Tax=Litoribaculum gwangyangense TaxID=1130722 RepID=A0ABP9CKQ2_9FLAO
MCYAQQLPIDFSSSSDNFRVFSRSSFSFSTDPTDANNPVGQFINDGSVEYQGFYIDLVQPIDLAYRNTLTLSFYSSDANAHNVILKLEQGTNPTVEVQQDLPSSSGNNWVSLTFDFGANAGVGSGTYNRLTAFIDGGLLVSGTYLIDDIDYGATWTEPNAIDVVYTDLVWEDNFDSGSTPVAINSTNWFHQTYAPRVNNDLGGYTWFNDELQHYTDRMDNSYLQNGELNIILKREDYTPSAQPGAASLQFTSARLNSKFSFTYGRVDVRAKLPARATSWPAIWTLGTNIAEVGGYWYQSGVTNTPWPACGEIDIMEHGLHADNTTSSAIHVPGRFGGNPFTKTFGLTDVVNDYHLYSVNWSPNKIVFLVDDTPYYSVTKTQMESNGGSWVFDLDQYLLLNVAVGGFAGTPDLNDFNDSSMVIDYVRVYQNTTLTVEDISETNFKIYPNPARIQLFIKSNVEISAVALYDIFGKQVIKESGDVKTLNVEGLNSGIYLLNIYADNAKIVKKVVID